MKGSMDRVHRGGPWTWGPCFVYVPTLLNYRDFPVSSLKCETMLYLFLRVISTEMSLATVLVALSGFLFFHSFL